MLKTVKKKKGTRGVIGIDEVGRGPLAGPVTVCAVYMEGGDTVKKSIFSNTIRDSKKLTKANRNNIFKTIRQKRYLDTKIIYSISSRSAECIDRIGIAPSIRACVLSCIRSLEKRGVDIANTQILLDAGLLVPLKDVKQKSFIKGDEKYVEIAVASIVAKVSRDTYMEKLAKAHVQYGWETNAGYGTVVHRNAIQKYGITKYHRKTYLKAFKLFDKTEY